VEQSGGYSLLLSGGDINTGVPESDALDAEPDFKGMTLLGYDAMAVGNHEFDNSIAIIRKQQSWSDFPFLAANIYDENKQRLFKPYKLFDFGKLKVGVIGLITHQTAFIGNREFISGLTFTLPEDETKKIIDEVRSVSDITIALTHMGHSEYDLGSDISLAKSVNGLDMIVGGHSSEAICIDNDGKVIATYSPGEPCTPDRVNGTWVMQAEEWGKYVGRADFTLQNGKLTLDSYQLIPVNLRNEQGEFVGDELMPDKDALALLLPFQQAGSEALAEVVGHAMGDYERNTRSYLPNASPLGKLITEAMMHSTGADLAFFNAGGIRAGIKQGEISRRDLLTVQPFNNSIVLNTFSGEALLDYFKKIELIPNNKKQMQFSGFYIDEHRAIKLSATGGGIEPKRKYLVAFNSFMAYGGDAYPEIDASEDFVDTGMLDHQILIDYIRSKKEISP
nr:5'-nucleotidase C-terminal domain-containing protein [Cellvibrionaceae bacterium]